ncbi:MAG: MarR family transcriptional regulator [Bacteroides sp.]|nr:MarR family transcriptional regulator [Bacteroides sp.]
MTNERTLYGMPNVGCMLGTAYQTLVSRLAEALAEAGLKITVSEYLILRALYTQDGMQQCEIAAMVGKDKGGVSRCVSAMVKKGLVSTECVSHKCLKVYLSPKGRGIEPKVMEVAKTRHEALSSMLTSEEKTVFARVLKKIIQ